MTSNGTAATIPLGEDGANTPEPATSADRPIKVPVATWPEALPSDEEPHVMSIVCGNSHLHWALHNNARKDELEPNLCEWFCAVLSCSGGGSAHIAASRFSCAIFGCRGSEKRLTTHVVILISHHQHIFSFSIHQTN